MQMIDLDLFFRYLKGRCRTNRFYEKNGKLPNFVALAFQNGIGYLRQICHYRNDGRPTQ